MVGIEDSILSRRHTKFCQRNVRCSVLLVDTGFDSCGDRMFNHSLLIRGYRSVENGKTIILPACRQQEKAIDTQ